MFLGNSEQCNTVFVCTPSGCRQHTLFDKIKALLLNEALIPQNSFLFFFLFFVVVGGAVAAAVAAAAAGILYCAYSASACCPVHYWGVTCQFEISRSD